MKGTGKYTLAALALFICLSMGVHTAYAERVLEFAGSLPSDRMHLLQAAFDAFTEKTGIKVNLRPTTGSSIGKWEEVMVQILGGDSPDVLSGVSLEFVQFAAQGLMEPLEAFIAREEALLGRDLFSDVAPGLVEALRWNDQQWMLPYGASGVPLAVNVDLFSMAGIPEPPLNWNDPSWTYDRFLDEAQKLTRMDGEGKMVQYGLSGPAWDGWITIPYNWGGDWVDPTLRRFTGHETEAVAALQALQDMRWTYHIMPQPGDPGGGNNGFLSGDSAVAGWGTWYLQAMFDSGLNLRLAPWFKVGNNDPVGVINPMGVVMLSTAPNKEEAWEFLKFISLDPEGNALWSMASGAAPAVGDAQLIWLEIMSEQAPNANLRAFIQQATEYPAFINIRRVTTFNEIHQRMTPAVWSVYGNAKSAQQAMNEIAPVIQALIDAGVQ